MTKLYNKTINKEKRRDLRKAQTKEELIFWAQVKDRRFHGYKFRRQYSIGNYVADFYCPELKLVVEIDGGQHFEEEKMKKDLSRTGFFEDLGIKVKRYTNIDIKNNLSGVLDDLLETCKKLYSNSPHSLFLSLPRRGKRQLAPAAEKNKKRIAVCQTTLLGC